MPFGGYEDFGACVRANSDKDDPHGYCAALERSLKKAEAEATPVTILKSEGPRRYTLGVVYEPNTPDAHHDYMTEEDIEKAAHGYLRRLQGSGPLAKAALGLLGEIAKAVESDEGVRVHLDDSVIEDVSKAGLNDMHMNTPVDDQLGEVVESYIAPADLEIGGRTVAKGSWLLGVVWNDDMFAKIQSGQRTGYSLEGRGVRV